MEITAITPQKKDATRCNIEVDGRFFCGMKLETALSNRLKAGMSVTEEELSRIQLEGEKKDALDKALTHISASMKTEREIRDYLKRKGYLPAVCDFVVERMEHYGFLDDAAYARAYVSGAGKKKGRRLITLELRRKGISEEAISSALDGMEGEVEGAKRALEKYLRGKPSTRETFAKAYRHLLSKGYDHETARAVLAACGEDDED